MKTTEYKDSEVRRIPVDWEVKKFKDVFSFLPTNTYAREFMTETIDFVHNVHYGDVLIRYGYILDFNSCYVPFLDSSRTHIQAKALLCDGDIIIADTAEDETVGKAVEVIGLNGRKAVSGLHTMLCRPKECVFYPGYLGYFMNSSMYHNQLLPLIVGTKVSSISKSAILDTYIIIPPIEQQALIAESLESVDVLLAKQETAIEKKRLVKEGLMQELLTGKKRLPGFSGEWVSVQLDSILSYEQPTKYLVSSTDYVESGIPVLTAGKSFVLGYTNENYGIYTNLPVIIFDDFVTESKYVSFPFKAKSSAMKMLRLRDDSLHNLRFIYSVMQLIDFPMIDHKRYWIKEYSKLYINIPATKAEEDAIEQIISDVDAEISALESQRDKYLLLKQGMMQELLTGKTRLI